MYSVNDNPVPGMPAVTRVPFGPTVYFSPLGPIEPEAPLLLRFSRNPGNKLTDLRKRKPIRSSAKFSNLC
jgi:hypothetical protein